MPITGSQKALMEARSNIARSGATRSGYFRAFTILLINGVDKSAAIWKNTISITKTLTQQPDTGTIKVYGFDPAAAQSVVIASGATDNRIFGGSILRARQLSVRAAAQKIYELE